LKNLIKITFVIISLLWLVGSLLPLFAIPGSIISFPFLNIFYSPVCHQESSKLICSNLGCSFLCARCVGIYSGVFLASLLILFRKNITELHIKYFLISSIPLLLDVILISSGFYDYSKTSAYFTGLIFGSAAFYYFYIGIMNWKAQKNY
jgi:uncharacterized membrane protein